MMSVSDAYVEGCDFCAIARGDDLSVQVVCEGEDWVAFFPLKPATKGHTLVIPRPHVADLWELEPPLSSELMTAVIRVGRAVHEAVRPEGMNLISSAGRAAEQTVFHLHLHVLPRWIEDGFDRIWPSESPFEDSDLTNVADRVRAACDSARP
jgi:diadenosine tetraphosphate (Ap4A) HIT family hydrolase